MFQNLFVAADHYEVKRLKLMCEDNLCKSLTSTDSIAAALAFAEEHKLCNLKDACIEFIVFSDMVQDVVASQGFKHLKRCSEAVGARGSRGRWPAQAAATHSRSKTPEPLARAYRTRSDR
jgi:hypothetical protein